MWLKFPLEPVIDNLVGLIWRESSDYSSQNKKNETILSLVLLSVEMFSFKQYLYLYILPKKGIIRNECFQQVHSAQTIAFLVTRMKKDNKSNA